jgi:hypothetical protein
MVKIGINLMQQTGLDLTQLSGTMQWLMVFACGYLLLVTFCVEMILNHVVLAMVTSFIIILAHRRNRIETKNN